MKICLVGSTRFRRKYEELNMQLSLAGHCVYTVTAFGHSGDPLTPAEKETLDLVHLQKIVESDAVVIVTDDEGYIGESTTREILWAKMLGKTIHSSQFPTHIDRLVESLPRKTFPVLSP